MITAGDGLIGRNFVLREDKGRVLPAWDWTGREVTLRNGRWTITDYLSNERGTCYVVELCSIVEAMGGHEQDDQFAYTVEPMELMRLVVPSQYAAIRRWETNQAQIEESEVA